MIPEKLSTSHLDPWHPLKKFTAARIALGRTGNSIPLKENLAFQLAHAHARDAVFSELENRMLTESLQSLSIPVLAVASCAAGRQEYLQRPDLGRQLSASSARDLEQHRGAYDVAIILADGLCARAINQNGVFLVQKLITKLSIAGFVTAPVTIASQARVALADGVGSLLGAKLAVILIGERPGLSSFDSIGAYLTYNPVPGNTDEVRNCVSNIRREGLQPDAAAEKICYLISEALRLKLTGIALKDNSGLIGEPGREP